MPKQSAKVSKKSKTSNPIENEDMLKTTNKSKKINKKTVSEPIPEPEPELSEPELLEEEEQENIEDVTEDVVKEKVTIKKEVQITEHKRNQECLENFKELKETNKTINNIVDDIKKLNKAITKLTDKLNKTSDKSDKIIEIINSINSINIEISNKTTELKDFSLKKQLVTIKESEKIYNQVHISYAKLQGKEDEKKNSKKERKFTKKPLLTEVSQNFFNEFANEVTNKDGKIVEEIKYDDNDQPLTDDNEFKRVIHAYISNNELREGTTINLDDNLKTLFPMCGNHMDNTEIMKYYSLHFKGEDEFQNKINELQK